MSPLGLGYNRYTRYQTLPELGRERPEGVASKVGETLRTAYVTSLVEAQEGHLCPCPWQEAKGSMPELLT